MPRGFIRMPESEGVNDSLGVNARSIDGGTSIAVDHDGLPWVTNSSFAVYQRSAPE
jgi:hypothetical protein